jgi:chromosome segregation ATPase
MSEDPTLELPDNRSFEERVFARFDAMESRFATMEARFDAMDRRFDGIDSRFGAVDARFEAMDARFEAMDAQFEAMDARFDTLEARFDAVDARLAGLDTRVQVLEAKAYDTKPIWERALAEILNVKERVENIERKFNVLIQDMMQLRGDQSRLEDQFDALKSKLA